MIHAITICHEERIHIAVQSVLPCQSRHMIATTSHNTHRIDIDTSTTALQH
jgi:hypothetical protein